MQALHLRGLPIAMLHLVLLVTAPMRLQAPAAAGPTPADLPPTSQGSIGAQIVARGAQYLCYTVNSLTPECRPEDSTCATGAHRAAGDTLILTLDLNDDLRAVGCASTGPIEPQLTTYQLRAGTPTLTPPSGRLPPGEVDAPAHV